MKHLLISIAVLVAAGCKKKGGSSETGKDRAPTPVTADDKGGGPGANNTGSSGPQMVDAGVLGRGKGGIDLEIMAGAIDKDVVRRVVKENTTKLQACYEKTLLANPSIEGKVITTFTIAAEGSVSDVKATGVHPEVESCVAETVKAFKFPPSGKKVDVSYPFQFKPA